MWYVLYIYIYIYILQGDTKPDQCVGSCLKASCLCGMTLYILLV